jgi:undecaprenyl pyrophosphate phosphatase UppP
MALTAVKLVFYILLIYFVLRVLFVLPVSAWGLICAVSVFIILVVFLSRIYEEAKKKIAENRRLRLLSALLVIERVLTLLCHMVFGVVMYRMWLREPQEAYIMLAVFLLLVTRAEYEERIKQIDSHYSGGCAPSS